MMPSWQPWRNATAPGAEAGAAEAGQPRTQGPGRLAGTTTECRGGRGTRLLRIIPCNTLARCGRLTHGRRGRGRPAATSGARRRTRPSWRALGRSQLPLAPTGHPQTAAQPSPAASRTPNPHQPRIRPGRLGAIELSSVRLIANVRRSRKGAAPGPSGCTGEHLRVLLDDEHCAELLLGAARKLAIAQVPGAILPAFRLGRMVALSKPSRDVRALVMGDAFRRLVARTLAQQLSTEFQRACAPFQFALSTKAGAEALARVVRAATESDAQTTILSVDGVGAYDHISRQSMLSALASRPDLAGVLPFASMFYGSPSTCLFYDERGIAHEVRQGEGGKQGDPLMPCLFALGQHEALQQARHHLHPSDVLYAFLDDIHVTGHPDRTAEQFRILQDSLRQHANIQVHRKDPRLEQRGRGAAWAAGHVAAGGSGQPLLDRKLDAPGGKERGVVVLGSPVGSRELVEAKLQQRLEDQDCLLPRIPLVPHLPCAWLLLLFCGAPRCTYMLRTLPPAHTAAFAMRHDAAVLSCLEMLLGGGEAGAPLPATSARRAQLPLRMGGLGLGFAVQERRILGVWADTLPALGAHHPGTLADLVRPLLDVSAANMPPSARAAEQAAQHLRSQGFDAPPWASLLERDEAAAASRSQWEGGHSRPGWQHAAGASLHTRAPETLFADLDPASRALLLSQGGEAPGCTFTATPSSPDTAVPDAEYRVLLLRRLRLPLPLAPKHCACGGLLDELGDHRSACAQVGALARRAGLLERAAARICKGAGARVATNVALRELNLDVPAADGRRTEVVANGLPLWQGAQIAIDATVVSPVRRDGSARPEADSEPGLALARALNRKHRTYPKLQRARRCKLVVFGVELGGRINRSTLTFLRQRAPWCVAGAQQALVRRWTALPSLAALRAHACSLLELPVAASPADLDGKEVPLGDLLAGGGPPPDSRLPGRTG